MGKKLSQSRPTGVGNTGGGAGRARSAREGSGEPTSTVKTPAAAKRVHAERKTEAQSGIAVIGSANIDLVLHAEAIPAPGQTLMGQELIQNPGGKGANQAAAAGKLWARRTAGARLIARVGDDLFAGRILAALVESRVDTASILRTRGMPSGVAMVIVDRHGENAIVVSGGANHALAATDLLARRRSIESAKVVLLQLETPAETVACAIALARRAGTVTILDPAPAPTDGLPESMFHVDILTPNQMEAAAMTGLPARTAADAQRAAERFLNRGTRTVIVKMGSQGALIVDLDETGRSRGELVPGFRVKVVDTTAAGDAFNGALAVALAEGRPLSEAVRFANAAGALTCTKPGAMAALPTRAEVDALVALH